MATLTRYADDELVAMEAESRSLMVTDVINDVDRTKVLASHFVGIAM